MKVFFSESQADYSSYTFSYAVYCLKESQTELPEIYARGFLPYTGRLDLQPEIFYLARSLRVDLGRFADTSENRRVDRKIAELGPTLEAYPKADFPAGDPEFRAFCLRYAEERFQSGKMDADRLEYVLGRESVTHILKYTSNDSPLGYVFVVMEGLAAHYWFSFFDTRYLAYSLGKWMMWRTIHWAKDQGCHHIYLGTCYTSKSLYKARDHQGIEFFDGASWNSDRRLLAELCRRDEQATVNHDLFKGEDPQFGVIFEPLRQQRNQETRG